MLIIESASKTQKFVSDSFNRNSKRCKDVYQAIYRIIEDCPRYEEMLLIASKFKIKEKDMINEVIFALL